ncbi:MAG: hypothetical protein AAFO62_01545, partial [Pseudomonadota bacterium]
MDQDAPFPAPDGQGQVADEAERPEAANDAAAVPDLVLEVGAAETRSAEARVVFMPSGRRGTFAIGTPVLEAARSLGVFVESVCGGRGICGRCQVTPSFGSFAKLAVESQPTHLSEFGATEQRYAEKRSLPADRRLSCSAKILGDVVIDVPTDTAINGQVVRKRSETRSIAADPAVRLYVIDVEAPRMEAPGGDLDRVLAALNREHGLADVLVDPSVFVSLQATLRAGGFRITAAVLADRDDTPPTLIGIWPGERETLYGAAIDIGSTTIACHLVDLNTGRTVTSLGTSNPQIRFGEDLMSRVSYAMLNPDGQRQMTDAVRSAVDDLVARA